MKPTDSIKNYGSRPVAVDLSSLGRRHSDAPAFNSEQQLCRERHLEGESWLREMECGGELDACHYS